MLRIARSGVMASLGGGDFWELPLGKHQAPHRTLLPNNKRKKSAASAPIRSIRATALFLPSRLATQIAKPVVAFQFPVADGRPDPSALLES
jgi:hypothetical protein